MKMLLVGLLLWCALCGDRAAQAAAPPRVAILSDLHINLGSKASCMSGHSQKSPLDATLWCDAPLSLVRAALEQLFSIHECYDALLVSGDVLRHRYEQPLSEDEALQTFEAFQTLVLEVFPNCSAMASPVLTLGNNDVMRYYPSPPPQGTADPWLSKVAGAWKVVAGLPDTQKTRFTESGFYSLALKHLPVRIVVLNTLYWASKNEHTAEVDDPAGGLAWLRQELIEARGAGQQVWLMGHVPPGIDHYDGAQLYHLHLQKALWQVLSETETQGNVVTAVLFGHEHVILERRMGLGSHLALLAGSVSPDKGNNPSVRVLSFGLDGQLANVQDWMLPLASTSSKPAWTLGGDYVTLVGEAPVNVVNLLNRLQKSAPLATDYARRCFSDTPSLECSAACRRALVCTVGLTQESDYVQCKATLAPSDWAGVLALIGGLVGVALLFMIALVVWKRRSTASQQAAAHATSWRDHFDAYTDDVDIDDADF